MPFLAPLISGAAAILAGGGVGAFLLKLGGSLILSAASSALMKKGRAADGVMQGRTVSVREPAASRRLVYGRARVGGTIVFMATRDTPGGGVPNNALYMVIVIAGHAVQEIGALYLNGELAWDASGPTARFAGHLAYEQHLGTAGASPPFIDLRDKFPDLWTAAHRLEGCAAIAISLNYMPSIYPSGVPNVTVDVRGCSEVYDPRTGVTGYSENPALCVAHYMAHPRYGLNAQIGAADGVATAELIAAANVCDEVVAKVGGGTEPRYSLNGIVDTSQEPKTVIEDMLTAMAGDMVPVSGQYRIFAGAWRPPTVTLTDDDVVDGGFQLTTRVSRAENFNGVRGKFVSPENDWAVDDFPAYASSVYLAEDKGERIWTDITLPFTISASMAQRLAKIHLERQRRQFTVTFPAKLSAWRVAPMDVVALTRPRWGFAGKPFEVRGMSLEIGETIQPSLTLRETSPAIYDWSASEAQVYAAAPRTTLPSPYDLDAPGTPTATESIYQTLNGAGVKARVTLTWPASPSAFAAVYQVETRLAGAAAWTVQGRTEDLSYEMNDWAPGAWSFRVKALSRLGVSSGYAQTDREIFGLAAAPAAMSGVTLQAAGGLAVIEWLLAADLDVRTGGNIVIRHSAAGVPAWDASVSMKTVPGNTALAVLPLKPGAYLLRPYDASGTGGPVSIVSTAGIQAIAFAPVSTLQEDAAFSGAKTDTIVDSGTLRLDTTGDEDAEADFDAIASNDGLGGVVPSGGYAFAAGMNFGAVKRVRLRSVIDLTVVGILDDVDTRPGAVDTWLSFDGTDGAEVDCVVEYRTTQTNPGGAPVWSDWRRVDATEESAWGLQARAILSTSDAGYSPAVSQLRLVAEEAT